MLNKWDSFFLMFMTVPIMGHVVILPLMLDVAGRDAWLCIFLALPVGLLFLWAILRLRTAYPRQDFRQMLASLFGRRLSVPLLGLFPLYFLFMSAYALAALVDMTGIAFMPETPLWAIALWFLLFCAYGASRGVKAIALTATALSLIAAVTGHSITLINTPNKEWGNLFPLLEFGLSPLLLGSLVLCSIWTEFLFLLVVPLQDAEKKKGWIAIWTTGLLFNGLMMLSTITGAIMTFGMGQSDNFTYPALETVRILSLGFIDRFDIYGLILMSFGTYIRTTLFLRIAYDLLLPAGVRRKWVKRGAFSLLALAVFVGASFMAGEHRRLEAITSWYTYSILLLLLPFLLLLLHWVKGRSRSRSRPSPQVPVSHQ